MTHENELETTLEQLARMHRALAALHAEKDRYSTAWLAVLAEGPLEEIRLLEQQLDVLTGRASLDDLGGDLEVRIRGADVSWPRSPVSVLTSVAEAMRKGVQTLAELLLTGDLSSRPTKQLNDACDLRLVSVATGSIVLTLELPQLAQPSLVDLDDAASAAKRGLELLVAGASWAASEESDDVLSREIPDVEQRRAVLTQLRRLAPRPRGKIAAVELAGRVTRHRTLALTRATTKRLDRAIDATATTKLETYEGDLREIDLDKRTLVLREVGTERLEVRGEYLPDLDATALDALDKRVSVTGTRSAEPARKRDALKIHRLTVMERDELDDSDG